MPAQRPPTKSFNVLLTDPEHELLQQLADVYMISKSTVIRRLIHINYGMKIKHVAQCATGQACLVPQMHAVGQNPAIGTAL